MNKIKDERISLINSDELSKPVKDHLLRKKEILKKYFGNDNQTQNDTTIIMEDHMNMTFNDNKTKLDELTAEINHLKEANKLQIQKLEESDKLNKEINVLLNNCYENYNTLESKYNAHKHYSSSIQKKLDLLNFNYNNLSDKYNNLLNSELGKFSFEKSTQLIILTKELDLYKDDINKLKHYILNNSNNSNLITTITDKDDQTNLLDSYLTENKKLKRIIKEYDNRNNHSSKRWTSLIKENKTLTDEIKELRQQLQNQKIHYTKIIEGVDNNLIVNLSKIPIVLSGDKKMAANYLIEQMNILMEDKRQLLNDNIQLDSLVKEIKGTNEKLAKDLKYHIEIMCSQDSIKRENDELKDLLAQQKIMLSINQVIDLEDIISNLTQNLQFKDKENTHLLKKLTQIENNEYLDANEMINSLTINLRDKDNEIYKLNKEIDKLYKQSKLESINKTSLFNQTQKERNDIERPLSSLHQSFRNKDGLEYKTQFTHNSNFNQYIENIEDYS